MRMSATAQDRLARLAAESGARPALDAVAAAAHWAAAELDVMGVGHPRAELIAAVSALDKALRAVAALRERRIHSCRRPGCARRSARSCPRPRRRATRWRAQCRA